MHTTELIASFDLLIEENFLEESTCKEIIADGSSAAEVPATVYGGSANGTPDERVRKATHLSPSPATIELIKRRLLDYKSTAERHFGLKLSVIEEPQFLRYRVGDFFVAHQDGNTGLIRLDTESSRKISVVIFLNDQNERPRPGTYGGGSLKFSDYRARPGQREFVLSAQSGMLVAFRSETTHEVMPVTRGNRYSIVSWYC